MAYNTDWFPGRRENQLAMANNWLSVFNEDAGAEDRPASGAEARGGALKKYEAWGIPAETVTELRLLYDAAQAALSRAKSTETRTAVTTAECRAAFAALGRWLRDIKDRYLKKPPLTDADFVSLELRVKDSNPSVIRAPSGQAEADISYPGPHLLALHIRPLAGTSVDPKADYGYAIQWGVMPHGGASVDEALSPRRYLMKAPVSGEELPHNKFSRRKKETFEFPPGDSGKKVFFCVRIENSKGDKGPWGPIVSAVIP